MGKALIRLVNVICRRGGKDKDQGLHKEGVYSRGYQNADHTKKYLCLILFGAEQYWSTKTNSLHNVEKAAFLLK